LGNHAAGSVLTITNWSGTALSAGTSTADRLLFSGLDTADFTNRYAQADISFNGTPGYAAIQFDATHFELVAIPEPSSTALIGAASLLTLVGFRERRRFRRHSA
jgi:uncharacterized SAM-dependent methyltransferase